MIEYGMLSTTTNALAGCLVKARCDFCGRKFGSFEEAKKCEAGHINKLIRETVIKKEREKDNDSN